MKGEPGIPQRVSIPQLARAVWRESQSDNVMGLAAQVSYYFSLALFPFLIFLAAVAGSLPVTGLWVKLLRWVIISLPQGSQRFIFATVTSLTYGHRSFLSLGMLGTIWAASTGLMNLMSALNVAYEVKETRSLIRRLAIALLMVIVLAFFFVVSFALLSIGDWADKWLADRMGPVLVSLWKLGRWVLSLILLAVGIAFVNFILPNLRRHVLWITPGSVFVVLAWVGATQTFNLYVRYVASYDKTYGALGAFVILMVWIYIISLITLIGAEINSEFWKMRSASSLQAPPPALLPPLPPSPTSKGKELLRPKV